MPMAKVEEDPPVDDEAAAADAPKAEDCLDWAMSFWMDAAVGKSDFLL